jgi:serine/threonine-protein kinase RsbT
MSLVPLPLAIRREVDVYIAMSYGRDLATRLGFNAIDRTKIEIMILELARNILRHADGAGQITVAPLEHADRRGLIITARDDGPGIVDVARAMEDGYSTAGTLGAGLPGVQRLADEFEIDSQPGRGTVIRAAKWVGPPARRRRYA